MANRYDNDNGGFWTIVGIIVFIVFAYISAQTPSSKDQADWDYYQDNGISVERAEYLQSENADDNYQYTDE